jgi:hypothetical protein
MDGCGRRWPGRYLVTRHSRNGDPRPRLSVEGDLLKLGQPNGALIWETQIPRIVLIAEYTTNEGPWCDDYFLDFWSNEEGRLLKGSVPLYVDGHDDALHAVEGKLGSKLEFGLTGSTEWDSRVMWPPELQNHKYFEFRLVQPSSWREQLKRFCLGPKREYFHSAEVRAFLEKHDAGIKS